MSHLNVLPVLNWLLNALPFWTHTGFGGPWAECVMYCFRFHSQCRAIESKWHLYLGCNVVCVSRAALSVGQCITIINTVVLDLLIRLVESSP
jgi:hypothetical protein